MDKSKEGDLNKEDVKQIFSNERCYRCGDLIKYIELDRYSLTKLCSSCDQQVNG